LRKILTLFLSLVLITLPFSIGLAEIAQGKDIYSSFRQLKAKQSENTDYCINCYDSPSSTAVIAIHGGAIELGTSELATVVASLANCDLYTFEGLKNSNNRILHITSTRFDEPEAVKLVARSEKTLSLHGCTGNDKTTYIGGLDSQLGKKIEKQLERAGFKVREAPARLAGKDSDNICNSNAIGKGVQLELTRALRESFFSDSGLTKSFYNYASALSAAL